MDWLIRVYNSIYHHLVLPFLETYDPPSQVALGAVVGMFVGLTPTMGVQMYVSALIWAVCRYIFRIRFNLAIAVALVWITNPVTVVPIYYLFLVTGQTFQGWVGVPVLPVSYTAFNSEVARLAAGGDVGWLEWIFYASRVLIVEYGWPMVLGSLAYAVPLSLASYPLTYTLLRRYRRYLAGSQGLTYEQWRERFETRS